MDRLQRLPARSAKPQRSCRHDAADPPGLEQKLEAAARQVERAETVLHRPAAGQVRLHEEIDGLALLGHHRLAGLQGDDVGIETRHRLGIDPTVQDKK